MNANMREQCAAAHRLNGCTTMSTVPARAKEIICSDVRGCASRDDQCGIGGKQSKATRTKQRADGRSGNGREVTRQRRRPHVRCSARVGWVLLYHRSPFNLNGSLASRSNPHGVRLRSPRYRTSAMEYSRETLVSS